ncbi:MAG: M1 family metallopeptidase, partial [Planctomycetota bacterium]
MNRATRLLAPFLLLLCGQALAAETLDATNRDFDQLHLTLRVEPDIRARTIRGEALLRFASLVYDMKRLRLHSLDTTVKSVTDGLSRELPFTHEKGILSIGLARPLAKGEESEVVVTYESKPTRGIYFHAPSEKHPHIPLSLYSQGEGTDNRRWIPCYDEPDDRLTLELLAVVPDELKTVSNGLKVSERYLPGPRREDHWVFDQRLPTYCICLSIGPYETHVEEHGKLLLETNAFKGDLDQARIAFGRVGPMIDFFGEYLGVPYPYGRYAHTLVWEFVFGGMENTTATTMNMRLLHPKEVMPNFSADSITAHELAHQWFGDYLTCETWSHIWLNEGFATYFTDLFFEQAEGTDEFRVRRWRQTHGYMRGTPHPERLKLKRSERGDQPLELFGGKQYNRGAAILHQLRLELGDDVFRKAMGRYVREHADSAVVTDELRRSVEREAGCDLSWFFDQWVYGAGYPALEVSYRAPTRPAWDRTASRAPPVFRGGDLLLTVRQTQPQGGGQGLFRLTVPVRVETQGGVIRERLAVHLREHEFAIPVKGAVRHVRVDDGAWLLARVTTKQPVGAWDHQARSDEDVVGRIDAIQVLEKHGERGAKVIAEVLEKDPFYAVRVEAARILARHPSSPHALRALLSARNDADSRVREAAYQALGGFTREQAGAAVIEGLRAEKHPYVLAAAARAAGRLHLEAAFETL